MKTHKAAFQEKKVSEYDQEIPQSQTADNPVAPRGRAAQSIRRHCMLNLSSGTEIQCTSFYRSFGRQPHKIQTRQFHTYWIGEKLLKRILLQ